LNRRIDAELMAALQQREEQGLQTLTTRVYFLEKQLAELNARPAAEAPPAVAPPIDHRVETEAPRATAWEATVTPEPVVAKAESEQAAPASSEPGAAPVYASPAPGWIANFSVTATTAEPEPSPTQTSDAPRELESNIGLTWINRIAAVTLILAAAFFFKYAVDNQWIGETGRIVLGVIAGFAALGCGEFAWRRDHKVYAQGVTALGVSILYLSFYAAFAFYHLPSVPQSVAFVLMALTCAMGGLLAMRYDASAIAVLALLGGYLTPVLLSTGVDRPWVLFSYILLLDLGALAAGRARKWGLLAPLAMAGTAVLYCAWFAGKFDASRQLVATVFALVYYVLFVLLESEVLVVLAQFAASLALLAIGSALGPGESWLLSNGWLFVAVAAAGIAVPQWRRWPVLTRATAAIFWLCFGVWQASFPNSRPEVVVPAAIAGFALFLGYLSWKTILRHEKASVDALAMMALNAAAAFGIIYRQLNPAYQAWLGLTAVAFAGVHLLVAARIWKGEEAGEERDATPVLLLLGVALSFLTLAVPIQFSAYRITMAWALEAAALAWIAWRTKSVWLSHGAMLVFALALFRLIAIDAWVFGQSSQYSLLANSRFLTFAVFATSLWLSVRWLHDKEEALTAYVGGHVIVLWALVMEVLGQVERSVPPGKVFSVGTVGVSVLIAAYGVILIGAFVLGRFAVNRLLGLILLGFVVLKLYLSDVWVLDRIYRVVAFGVLGILLLLTSFLYSRYRTKLGSWLTVEK
jgi:uncharacterized membrane protein